MAGAKARPVRTAPTKDASPTQAPGGSGKSSPASEDGRSKKAGGERPHGKKGGGEAGADADAHVTFEDDETLAKPLETSPLVLDEPRVTCGVFSLSNPVRLFARRLVHNRAFDSTIDLCIVANCLTLALRSGDPNGSQCAYHAVPWFNVLLFLLDLGFTTVFTSELVLKLIVFGAAGHPQAYFHDGWNWIDAFVVSVSVLGLLPDLCVFLGGLSALRAVRLLRTLRSIKQLRAMAATVQALIDAGPKLSHVGILVVFIFCCFGILGVQVKRQPPPTHRLACPHRLTRPHPARRACRVAALHGLVAPTLPRAHW